LAGSGTRDKEFTRLQAALGAAVQGRGQMVSVIGEAGLGKSRLVAELKGRVTSDERRVTSADELSSSLVTRHARLLWLEGRCLELSMATSYAPFLDLFREHFGLAPEAHDPTRAARLTGRLEQRVETGHLSQERMEEIAPLLGRLLSARLGDVGDERLPNTDPGERKRQTLGAIRGGFEAPALRAEWQWCDPLQTMVMVQGKHRIVGRGLLRGAAFYLRLERKGERLTAVCSADGVHWLTCGRVREQLRTPAEGENRIVTVLFADMSRSV
jgi:AAA ATPase-like protein